MVLGPSDFTSVVVKGLEVVLDVFESAGDMMVILASNSPRRHMLLSLLGLEFIVTPAEIDETPRFGETPMDYVVRLSEAKAQWVSDHQSGGNCVIAADTTVVDGNQILGKPANGDEAGRMLRQLRGCIHQVYTGIALAIHGTIFTDLCGTDVPMRCYSDEEIAAYIESGDPLDKAGGYAIQHAGFHPVEDLNGCFANVMGLPLCHLSRALLKHELDLAVDVPAVCQQYIGYTCLIYREILSEKT